MAQFKLAEVRELCTEAELRLYQASGATQMKSLSGDQLFKLRERARQHRDKWRDMAQKQQRSAQQSKGGRAADLPQRSARKADLFQEILDRVQMRIDALDAKPARPAAKTTTKQTRTVQHRATRAAVRKDLQEQVETKQLASKKPPVKKTVAKSAPAPVKDEPTPAPAESAAAPTSTPAPKRPRPDKAPTPNPGLVPNAKQQLKAQTAAKSQRVKASGLTTRVRGHVSAQNKRAQAARNQRKRT